jgi:hypothetical protein
MHECPICGQEFSLGQALRGHMIRHKAITNEESRVYLDGEFFLFYFISRWVMF